MYNYITTTDQTSVSVANFVTIINSLNEALNNCGNWATRTIDLIQTLQADPNFATLISAEKQAALATCVTELSETQTAVVSALGSGS